MMWYPWFPFEWRNHPLVPKMTCAQRDIYRSLIEAYILQGAPLADEEILRKLTFATRQEWRKAWPVVQQCFEIRHGKLYDAKLEERRRQWLKRMRLPDPDSVILAPTEADQSVSTASPERLQSVPDASPERFQAVSRSYLGRSQVVSRSCQAVPRSCQQVAENKEPQSVIGHKPDPNINIEIDKEKEREELSKRLRDDKDPASRRWWEFAQLYPVKIYLDAGARAYVSCIDTEHEHRELMDGLNRYLNSERWRDENGELDTRYIPRMDRFIFERMYRDHPPEWKPKLSKREREWQDALRRYLGGNTTDGNERSS